MKRLICIGDSLTYGYGVSFGKNWIAEITNLTGIKALNFGINGDTTGYMLERVTRNIIPNVIKPGDLAIVMGGENDVLTYGADEYSVNNVMRIVDELKNHGINSIVGIQPGFYESVTPFYGPLSLQKLNENYNKFADSLIEECMKKSIIFLDLRETFQGKSQLFIDGVHPNEEGHYMIAKKLEEILRL